MNDDTVWVKWHGGMIEQFPTAEDAEEEMLVLSYHEVQGFRFGSIEMLLHHLLKGIRGIRTRTVPPVPVNQYEAFCLWDPFKEKSYMLVFRYPEDDSEVTWELRHQPNTDSWDLQQTKLIRFGLISELDVMLEEEFTKEGRVRVALKKVADLIESTYAHDGEGKRTTPPRPTEKDAENLVALEKEIFAALNIKPKK